MRNKNPDYGKGVFRRRLRFTSSEGSVLVELEDCNHAFRVRLNHDGERVTDVDADIVRHPFVTCPEALRPLRQMVGCALGEDAASLRSRMAPSENCTHLYDMAMFALDHARDVGLNRLYDIAVADERDGVTHARIECDGQVVHDWHARAHTLVMPESYAGKPMMRGFYAWVSAEFSGMPLEAAVALQRGYFVAQSRRFCSASAEDNPATADQMPDGTCYSYNFDVVHRAKRVQGSVWDLTDKPGHLLQFRTQP